MRRPYDDEDDEEDDRPRRKRRSQFTCPFCGSHEPPDDVEKVSAVGWVLFAILCVVLCFPLCWIGLLIKETTRVCSECGTRIG